MTSFVAAADESVSGDGGGEFYFGGFVAPELDWPEYFAGIADLDSDDADVEGAKGC